MPDSFVFHAPDNEFLLPYIEREVGKNPPPLAVMVSSTDIYEPDSASILAEDAPSRTDSIWAMREAEFLKAYPDGVILRAAPIIGTGMTGAMRRLAEDIYRGRFFHFPGNEARKSIVHAVDIAAVVAMLLKTDAASLPGNVFNITDDTDPLLHDLAEALAFRMDNKRISNISTRPQQLFAKWFYGRRYDYYSSDERFSCEALKAAVKFTPTPVCAYLRTHVYDESSL